MSYESSGKVFLIAGVHCKTHLICFSQPDDSKPFKKDDIVGEFCSHAEIIIRNNDYS